MTSPPPPPPPPPTSSCKPCKPCKPCPPISGVVLTALGAVLLFLGIVLLLANVGLDKTAHRLLFNSPDVASYGPSDPRLRDGAFLAIGDPNAKNVAVVLHGTASDAGHMANALGRASSVLPRGWAVWVPEYPGFGILRESSDASEAGSIDHVTEVVERAQQVARERGGRTLLMGHSLGTGVAVGVAEKLDSPVDRLVLVSPFTSFKDVVAATAPGWALLLPERFRSLHRASTMPSPPNDVAVYHGTKDQLIPMAQGRRLADAFRAEFHPLEGVRHEDVDLDGILARETRNTQKKVR